MDALDYFSRVESFSVSFDVGCGNTIREMFRRAYKNIIIRSVVYEINISQIPVTWFSTRLLQLLQLRGKAHYFSEIVGYAALLSSTQSSIARKLFEYIIHNYNQTGLVELINVAREAYSTPSTYIETLPTYPQITYFPNQPTPIISSKPSILSIPTRTGGV